MYKKNVSIYIINNQQTNSTEEASLLFMCAMARDCGN